LHGLRPVAHANAIAAWEPDDPGRERLARLSDRHVLAAARFELTETAARRRTTAARFERRPAPRAHTGS
jgi:hypothetical protein